MHKFISYIMLVNFHRLLKLIEKLTLEADFPLP